MELFLKFPSSLSVISKKKKKKWKENWEEFFISPFWYRRGVIYFLRFFSFYFYLSVCRQSSVWHLEGEEERLRKVQLIFNSVELCRKKKIIIIKMLVLTRVALLSHFILEKVFLFSHLISFFSLVVLWVGALSGIFFFSSHDKGVRRNAVVMIASEWWDELRC